MAMTTSAIRPLAVRWIIILSWLKIGLALVLAAVAIAFTSPMDSPNLEHFRRGWIRGAGHDWETYGAEQAGEVFGGSLIPVILASLMLVFVARRTLKGLRVAAAVSFLMSVTVPLSWPVTLTTLILTFRDSTTRYCEDGVASGARTITPPVDGPAT